MATKTKGRIPPQIEFELLTEAFAEQLPSGLVSDRGRRMPIHDVLRHPWAFADARNSRTPASGQQPNQNRHPTSHGTARPTSGQEQKRRQPAPVLPYRWRHHRRYPGLPHHPPTPGLRSPQLHHSYLPTLILAAIKNKKDGLERVRLYYADRIHHRSGSRLTARQPILRCSTSALPKPTEHNDLEVQRNRCRLMVQSAGLEAILANRSQNVLIHLRANRPNDLQVRGHALRVNQHGDDDLPVDTGDPRRPLVVGEDVDGVDELGSSDASRDPQRARSRSGAVRGASGKFVRLDELGLQHRGVSRLGLGRRICLSVKHNGGQGECCHNYFTHNVYLQDRSNRHHHKSVDVRLSTKLV